MKLSHAASTTLTAIAELQATIGVGSGVLLGGGRIPFIISNFLLYFSHHQIFYLRTRVTRIIQIPLTIITTIDNGATFWIHTGSRRPRMYLQIAIGAKSRQILNMTSIIPPSPTNTKKKSLGIFDRLDLVVSPAAAFKYMKDNAYNETDGHDNQAPKQPSSDDNISNKP